MSINAISSSASIKAVYLLSVVVPAAFLEEAQLPTGSVAADAPSVRVKVVPAPPPDPVLKGRISDVERKRADAEAQMFEQATAEMKDLTQVVVSARPPGAPAAAFFPSWCLAANY